MTIAATLRLPEAEARALFDALITAEDLPWTLDLSEVADGWEVVAYLGTRAELKPLNALSAVKASGARFTAAELPATDWVAKSLAGLAPVRVGRFLVHGEHDRDKPRSNDIGIEIPAAQAFGTGHHGTTAGCLAALERLGHERRFERVLDLGTGSGVLAIGIAKAWRTPVLATDNDPVAVRVAAENIRVNHVEGLVRPICAAGFDHRALRGARFDLIVANILAGPLAAMAHSVAAALWPGGSVVLSGLLPTQQAFVVAAYRNQGLALRRAVIRDGWLILTLGSWR